MAPNPAPGAIAVFTDVPEEAQSAVSWPAVFAGAVAALAVSFVLIALAAGFGLRLASPWPGRPASDSFTPILGAILVAVQVIASGFGGYLAGRLRTKWLNVHGHEVHFRDTAHGLLVWALSTLAGVVLAAGVMAPAAGHVSAPAVAAAASSVGADPNASLDSAAVRLAAERAEGIAAQVSLFMGVGLLLSAFTASVAAGIGGIRRDEMHTAYWSERTRTPG